MLELRFHSVRRGSPGPGPHRLAPLHQAKPRPYFVDLKRVPQAIVGSVDRHGMTIDTPTTFSPITEHTARSATAVQKLLLGAGRSGRGHYLVFPILAVVAAGLLSAGIEAMIPGQGIGAVVGLPLLWVCAMSALRRLHDLGKDWRYLLWGLVPIVSAALFLYLLFSKGDPEENRFGPVPDGAWK